MTHTSYVYTTDGDIVPIETHTHDALFRKMQRISDASAQTEQCIVNMLYAQSCPNVVRIICVGDDFYDGEFLDTDHTDNTTKADDIRQAIEQLHAMGIVYVDLKHDNMGYSHADACWKLFDFDFSGIYRLSEDGSWCWDREPSPGYSYKKFRCKLNDDEVPTRIDWLVYDELFPKSQIPCNL